MLRLPQRDTKSEKLRFETDAFGDLEGAPNALGSPRLIALARRTQSAVTSCRAGGK
jgi:hypothetical protein